MTIEDRGDRATVNRLSEDPIAAVFSSVTLPPGITVDDLRREARDEEAPADSEETAH